MTGCGCLTLQSEAATCCALQGFRHSCCDAAAEAQGICTCRAAARAAQPGPGRLETWQALCPVQRPDPLGGLLPSPPRPRQCLEELLPMVLLLAAAHLLQ